MQLTAAIGDSVGDSNLILHSNSNFLFLISFPSINLYDFVGMTFSDSNQSDRSHPAGNKRLSADGSAPEFNAKKWVDEKIAANAVVVISKSHCPYCPQTAQVLKKYDANVHKIEINRMPNQQMQAIQAYCNQLTGASSVPRVFIGGQSVGGCDDTKALDRDGTLKRMIVEAKK